MPTPAAYSAYRPIHPVHAATLGGVLPLYVCTLIADYAYYATYQIQWSTFAAWLLVAAMVMTTLALLAAVIGQVRGSRRLLYTLALAATWVLGFINSLQHARDGWAVMPGGLWLSTVLVVLALLVTALGFSSLRRGGVR